jgi:hypothetical protein
VGPRAGLDRCGKSHRHRDFFSSEHPFIQLYCVHANTILYHGLSASSLDVTATGSYTPLTGSLLHNTFRSTILACTQAPRYAEHTLPYHPHFPLHEKELLVSRIAATSTSCVRVLGVHSPSRRCAFAAHSYTLRVRCGTGSHSITVSPCRAADTPPYFPPLQPSLPGGFDPGPSSP